MVDRNSITSLSTIQKKRFKYKIKFFIHPSFILLVLWFVIFFSIYDFLMFIGVVLSHELGHALVAKKLGYKLDSFFIAPYGVKLNYKDKCFDSKDELKIALAGPLVNLILAVLAVSLWWIAPVTYIYLDDFVLQSLMLCLVNLLPCYPLDGGRIFVSLTSEKMSRKKAIKFSRLLNYIFSTILFIIFITTSFYNFNPSTCLFAVFLVIESFDSKFVSHYISVLFKRRIKNFSKVCMFCVDDNVTIASLLKHIEPNKHTLFAVSRQGKRTHLIDEEDVKVIAIKYPLTKRIKDVIQQEKV